MTTKKDTLIPIVITPGVQPSTDKTALATEHYTYADKIRFRFGLPQKIGGWIAVLIAYSKTISGFARSLFSAVLGTQLATIIGTNAKLYSLYGSILTNITPLQTATVAIANSLATDYGTLANNPITTVSGSTVITIADANYTKYQVGDTFNLSGATATGGITIGQLNTNHVIHTIVPGGYTTITGGTASSSTSGGGAAVVRATGRITVTAATHGQANGDRTKIAGAANTGGINAASFINAEFIIRNVATNTFDIMTGGIATSAVTGGGGASTTYQKEIPVGAINQSIGQGYGMGLYGIGLFGTALLSSTSLVYPRIWFIDRYGSTTIMTAGNQTGLYQWDGSDAAAPVLVANAPTAINYAFESDNIVVTLGAGGIPNRIFSSDQANLTQWTASSSNQVFDYTVTGAGRLKSHVSVAGVNLIWSDTQTYLFAYLGYTAGVANAIWNVQQLEPAIGLIAPMARCAVAGTAYWMGQNNFYMWSSGDVEVIPANTQEESTILNYVFQNINRGQASKCFAWHNEKYDEIWFHYPSAGSNECDRVARLNRKDKTWVPDTFARTCAEYPNQPLGYPRLIDTSSTLFQHEQGVDANGSPMPWALWSNLRGAVHQRNLTRTISDKTSMLTGFVPDSNQTGSINVEIIGKLWPQSSRVMFDKNYTVDPTTEQVTTENGARIWQYKLSGNALGQTWQAGVWQEWVQESSKQ